MRDGWMETNRKAENQRILFTKRKDLTQTKTQTNQRGNGQYKKRQNESCSEDDNIKEGTRDVGLRMETNRKTEHFF